MRRALALVLAAVFCGCSGAPTATPSSSAPPLATPRVLLFTKTAKFRHSSIGAAVKAVRRIAASNGFAVDATEDATRFSDDRLARYAAVVFLLTTGDVLNDEQQHAFEGFVGKGGGFAGVHSASDTEYDWPFYGRLVGAFFRSHPKQQRATAVIEDPDHESTRALPARWTRFDEWYNFRSNPRARVHVLATLDESTYTGGTMGKDHPFAWCNLVGQSRAWYTAGGHGEASYGDPMFLAHVAGGIRWAAGLGTTGCA